MFGGNSRAAGASTPRAPILLKLAVAAVLAFLYIPFLIIILYAFSTEDATFTFPPPGLTLRWFGVAWARADVWQAIGLSLRVAAVSTAIALVLGTLAALAVYRSRFFGREAVSFLLLLPNIAPALLAGGMLAFALSFDEVIVTTFTAGQQETLPIWILSQLVRPRNRPVTNVVAVFVIAATFIPILLAHRLTRDTAEVAGGGK